MILNFTHHLVLISSVAIFKLLMIQSMVLHWIAILINLVILHYLITAHVLLHHNNLLFVKLLILSQLLNFLLQLHHLVLKILKFFFFFDAISCSFRSILNLKIGTFKLLQIVIIILKLISINLVFLIQLI